MLSFLKNILHSEKNKSVPSLNTLLSKWEYVADDIYEKTKTVSGKKLIWCIDPGRSGTRWLSTIFDSHKGVIGSCERNPFMQHFYRYVRWNNLPIDLQGILETEKSLIWNDWKNNDVCMTSHFYYDPLDKLIKYFHIDKVIWAVNNPRFTLTSFLNKGVYSNEHFQREGKLAAGPQPEYANQWSHNFSRIVPNGERFQEWAHATPVGKIACLLNDVNLNMYQNIKKVDPAKVWVFKLEDADQNYEYYQQLANWFNLSPQLSKERFLSLKENVVKPGDNVPRHWTDREEKEYNLFMAPFLKLYKSLPSGPLLP